MRPSSALNYVLNRRDTDAMYLRYRRHGLSFLPKFSDISDGGFIKLGQWALASAAMPVLRDHVLTILIRRSERKMSRIAASWVVALVKHKHSVRNGAIGDFPGQPMRIVNLVVNLNGSVGVTALAGIEVIPLSAFLPFPTLVRTADIYSITESRFPISPTGMAPVRITGNHMGYIQSMSHTSQ